QLLLFTLSPLLWCFFMRMGRPPCSTLFPYTTLFRSFRRAALLRPSGSECSPRRPTGARPSKAAPPRAPVLTKSRLCISRYDSWRSEEHTSELQSRGHLVCRLLPEKKKNADGILMVCQ